MSRLHSDVDGRYAAKRFQALKKILERPSAKAAVTYEEFSALYEFLDPEGADLTFWQERKRTGRPSLSLTCQLC